MPDKRRPDRHAKPPAPKTDPMLRNLKGFVVEEIEATGLASPVAPPSGSHHTPRSRWRGWPTVRAVFVTLGLVAIIASAALVTRGLWPSDETRLLAVAWEMWTRADWLVPRFNGVVEPLAPLFFWVVHLGWRVLGEVEWWPRLVPVLFTLGSMLLTARIAVLLWPGQPVLARHLPLVLVGSFSVALSAVLFSLHSAVAFFTLLVVHALLWRWRTRDHRVWLWMGIAFGLGLLASGSVILLYVLPVALLAPMWGHRQPTVPWKYWYADLFKALVLAGVIFALWALPAIGRGGLTALLPVVTAPWTGLALDLLPADRPWWWLLFLLPWLAFPWSLWPLPWLRLWHIRRKPIGNGLGFCLLWATTVIAIFSFLPVRQPQMLLPVAPAFFLVVGWLLLDDRHEDHDHSRLASAITFPLLLLGGALAILPGVPRIPYLPEFLWSLSPFVGVTLILVGVAIGWMPIPALTTRVLNMAVTVTVLTALGLLALGWQLQPHYELAKPARLIAQAQEQGQLVAHVGQYSGEYHFAGRLRAPLELLTPQQVAAWSAANPRGLLVSHDSAWSPRVKDGAPLLEQPFGEETLRLWPVAALTVSD